ncbi:hypothetical protein GOP47_0003777 [Adiantum capillus-veneris]|uniref:Uncharacterized protein n=1 Tax=Adiantum capillus-veneris TaxID=13818 RepID=A0A9D4V6C0_ADICA|nr:hypothetical protein GOP47_0003777 [Adiantum capillus-veneris]
MVSESTLAASFYGNVSTTWVAAPEVGGLDGMEFCDMSKPKFCAFAPPCDDPADSEFEGDMQEQAMRSI